MPEDSLLNLTKLARADCRPNILKCHIRTTLSSTGNLQSVQPDKPCWPQSLEFVKQSFVKKYSHVMPTRIASCCHIVFVSSIYLFWFPKWRTPPPPGTVFDVNFRWKSEGGSDKRVSQASASSVVRLDKVPSCIDETQWEYCLHPVCLTPAGPSKGCLA